MLESLGIQPLIVNDGLEALEAVREQKFDLVFMDIHMPKMDGLQSTREIRRLDTDRGTRSLIVALTANAMEGDREKFIAAGMDDHLSKPFQRNILEELLNKWLTGQHEDTTGTENFQEHGESARKPFIATAPSESSDALDLTVIDQLRQPYQRPRIEKLQRLITLYRETAKQTLAELQQGIETKDAQAIASAAHKLKSPSGNLGAINLANLLNLLESNARQQLLQTSEEEIDQIQYEYQRVIEALSQIDYALTS